MRTSAVILWARNRRVRKLGVVLAATLLLSFVGGTRGLVLPVLFGSGAVPTPLVVFAPVLWGAAVAQAFSSRTQALEARPCRRFVLYDAGLFVALGVAAAVAFSRVVTVAGPSLFGVGSMLIASGLAGSFVLRQGVGSAVFVLSSLALVTSMYGVSAPAARYVRVLAPDSDPWWSLICGCLATGVAVGQLLTNRIQTQLRIDEVLD